MADPVEVTSLDKLASALSKFQANMPKIAKAQTAKIKTKTGADYSYKFADLADIWEAIRKPLSEVALAVTQPINTLDQRSYLDTTIWHESGQHLDSRFELPLSGKTPQEAGSVITYYKRYALAAALGIATEEDDDGAAGNKAPVSSLPAKQESQPSFDDETVPIEATDDQWDLLYELAKKLRWSPKMSRANFAKINTPAQADKFIEAMEQRIQDAAPAIEDVT